MSDMIDRDAAIALPPYDGDGDPAGQFDHHIFVKLADLRALPAVEVRVKPLEWMETYTYGGKAYDAVGINKVYRIVPKDGREFYLTDPDCSGFFATLEAAKAAAQSDYDARIRSALTIAPVPDAGKVQALVDALEFYADRDNYEPVYERMPCDCCTDIYEPVKRDEGDTARAALAAWKDAPK